MTIDEAKQIEKECLLDLYSRIRGPMVIARGEGVYLWDTEGKRYLDFASGGRAVTGLGHCPPQVVAAVQAQADTLIHVSNDFFSEPQLKLAQLLHALTGGGRVFFCNSGAEANEAAIKLARKYGKQVGAAEKYEIVTALDSFHGRTIATLAATGQPKYHKGYEPLVPGFKHVPFNDAGALERAVSARTCAVMLEPILGESGVFPASEDYLRAARRLCDQHQALLILDEVQTGLGRTGTMFAYQQYGLKPDILTLAKALGGGVPIGATIAWEPCANAFQPGDHATTFGGSPLPAAAAFAALTAIRKEGLAENARVIGVLIVEQLEAMRSREPMIWDVRGRGLMIGVTLTRPKAVAVKQACREAGLLIATVGDSILRLLPPLILKKQQAEEGLRALEAALAQAAA